MNSLSLSILKFTKTLWMAVPLSENTEDMFSIYWEGILRILNGEEFEKKNLVT